MKIQRKRMVYLPYRKSLGILTFVYRNCALCALSWCGNVFWTIVIQYFQWGWLVSCRTGYLKTVTWRETCTNLHNYRNRIFTKDLTFQLSCSMRYANGRWMLARLKTNQGPQFSYERTNPSCLLFIAGWSFLRRIRGRVNKTKVEFSKGAYTTRERWREIDEKRHVRKPQQAVQEVASILNL